MSESGSSMDVRIRFLARSSRRSRGRSMQLSDRSSFIAGGLGSASLKRSRSLFRQQAKLHPMQGYSETKNSRGGTIRRTPLKFTNEELWTNKPKLVLTYQCAYWISFVAPSFPKSFPFSKSVPSRF